VLALIGVDYNWGGLCTKHGFGTEKAENNLFVRIGSSL
jgi:hypothetical protein